MNRKNDENRLPLGLKKNLKELVRLTFIGNFTNDEIAKNLKVSEPTIRRWKEHPVFVKTLFNYSLEQMKEAVPSAVNSLILLATSAKSEMVRLQAVQVIFKYSRLISDNSTPELDKARLRKAIAEAELTEIKAEQLKHVDENAEDKLSRIADVLWGDSSDKGK